MNNKSYYCIYTVNPKTGWIKVGYGNEYRPSSNDYYTGFGVNCDLKIWFFDIKKEECFEIEQNIHKYLTEKNIKKGEAGKECYISTIDYIHELIEECMNKEKYSPDKIENTNVIDHRKKYSKEKIDINSFNIIYYNTIQNTEITCHRCGRECRKHSYECFVRDEEGNEKYILIGPECFKKIKCDKISENFYNWLTKEYNNVKSNAVETFISDYLCDSRISFLPKKFNINICQLPYQNVKPLMERFVCHVILVRKKGEEKTFKSVITKDLLKYYNLNIDIAELYTIVSSSNYFTTGDYDYNKEEFDITFNHPKINKEVLSKFFCNLRTEIFNYSKELDLNISYELVEEQQNCLKSHIPLIGGPPGTGKSAIIKYILNSSDKKEKILLISPTYTSLELLMEDTNSKIKIKDRTNIKSIVIDSWNNNRTDIKNINTLIVDEICMFNIFNLYKLKKIIKKYDIKKYKFFGDIFQIPPICFTEESNYIHNDLHKKSMILTKNYRAVNHPIQVNFLNNNKTDFKTLDYLSKVFKKENFTEQLIVERIKLEDHIFISTTNKTINDINNICYKYEKKKCICCVNNIKIDDYTFCKECIINFKWRIGDNIKFDNEKNISEDYKEKELPKKKDIEYSNKVFISEKNGDIKYIKNKKSDYHMFNNGQIINISINENGDYDIKTKNLFYMKSIFNLKLKLSFALTVNKCQGMTKEHITFIIDRNGVKNDSIYTALTRARNLDDILVLNKLNIDNIDFNNNNIYYPKNNFEKRRQCESIYKPRDTKNHLYGKSYIDVYKIQKKEKPGWLHWIINDNPSSKHKNIFKLCENYEKFL